MSVEERGLPNCDRDLHGSLTLNNPKLQGLYSDPCLSSWGWVSGFSFRDVDGSMVEGLGSAQLDINQRVRRPLIHGNWVAVKQNVL